MIMIDGQDVVREAAAQASGVTWVLSDGQTVTSTDIAALDSFTLADVGANVVDPLSGNLVQATAESFFKALISVISRIEVLSRAYTGDLSDLMITEEEWGGFIERVYFHLGDIITDPKWNLADNYANGITDYAAAEHGFYPLQAEAKIFREATPLLTPISHPVDQLKEAVRNEDEMRALINGIRVAIRNTIALGLQSIRHMLAQCAIAVSIAGTSTAINLLAAYQTETGDTSVTVSNWQTSEAFQAFSMMKIAETRDNLRTFNTAFNDGSVPIFTDEGESKLVILNKFDKILRFGVKANTYHAENLALGDYSTVTAWQGYNAGGTATDYDFASVSKIMISADSTNKLGIGTSAFTQAGVVGLLFDRYALGISPYKRKVTTQYTAVGDYLNEFHHTLVGTILDTKYPIIAFYIATP
jgi:hypothetical protein